MKRSSVSLIAVRLPRGETQNIRTLAFQLFVAKSGFHGRAPLLQRNLFWRNTHNSLTCPAAFWSNFCSFLELRLSKLVGLYTADLLIWLSTWSSSNCCVVLAGNLSPSSPLSHTTVNLHFLKSHVLWSYLEYPSYLTLLTP